MINKRVKLTAGLLAAALLISSIPAEAAEAADTAEVTTYIKVGTTSFSAGAHSAINETVVLNTTEDEILVDNEAGVTENDTPIVAEPEGDVEEVVDATPENPYANIAIATGVSAYLNVRAEANADSAVLGKMYKNNAAIVLEQVGEWYKVETGSMTGYIHSEYVVVGDEEACKEAATITAKVTVDSLRLRKKATTSSGIYAVLAKGNKVTVVDDSIEGWLKVKYKSYTGYISADYADVSVSYTYGESKEEEAARKAEEEAAAAKKQNQTSSSSSSNKTYSEPTGSDAQALIEYALQFVGNKYKWGGTSLTNGIDCSGFVMKIYEKFGYDLPHSSYKLRSVGVKVSESELQPGDIICYSGHVAIYIGDGKIVHAASKKQGIIVSNTYKIKKVITIRRVLD